MLLLCFMLRSLLITSEVDCLSSVTLFKFKIFNFKSFLLFS